MSIEKKSKQISIMLGLKNIL